MWVPINDIVVAIISGDFCCIQLHVCTTIPTNGKKKKKTSTILLGETTANDQHLYLLWQLIGRSVIDMNGCIHTVTNAIDLRRFLFCFCPPIASITFENSKFEWRQYNRNVNSFHLWQPQSCCNKICFPLLRKLWTGIVSACFSSVSRSLSSWRIVHYFEWSMFMSGLIRNVSRLFLQSTSFRYHQIETQQQQVAAATAANEIHFISLIEIFRFPSWDKFANVHTM